MIRKQVILTEGNIEVVQVEANRLGVSFSEMLRRLIASWQSMKVPQGDKK